jgi:SpoVK/Ycf46/Vps4 family AAA+-type ATPase
VYACHGEEEVEEMLEDGEQDVAAFTQWLLPHRAFRGLWESLVFDQDLPARLLRIVQTALLFSRAGVDETIVACNRLILLYGPPGTGKTTLAKALGQKLSIRLQQEDFRVGQFIEVNAHSLFSKWFSESGKLVSQMFAKIREMLEEPHSFVVILVDEVESLSSARAAAIAGNEPSDAIRVVNAVLTQLDSLRRYKNALVVCTSNCTAAIDVAFLDRADVKEFVPLPGVAARYSILRSCANELLRAKVCGGSPWPEQPTPAGLELSNMCEGLSGRALRKLPFLAVAACGSSPPQSDDALITAFRNAAEKERASRAALA